MCTNPAPQSCLSCFLSKPSQIISHTEKTDVGHGNKVTCLLRSPLDDPMSDRNSEVSLTFGFKENSKISQNIAITGASNLVCFVGVRNF